jgi:hypothetical protein
VNACWHVCVCVVPWCPPRVSACTATITLTIFEACSDHVWFCRSNVKTARRFCSQAVHRARLRLLACCSNSPASLPACSSCAKPREHFRCWWICLDSPLTWPARVRRRSATALPSSDSTAQSLAARASVSVRLRIFAVQARCGVSRCVPSLGPSHPRNPDGSALLISARVSCFALGGVQRSSPT